MTATSTASNDLKTEAPAGAKAAAAKALGTDKEPGLPKKWFVLDTTAKPLTGQEQKDRSEGFGPRAHEMIIVDGRQSFVKTFTFQPGKAMELPIELAIKFLKNPGFIRADEDGNPLPYHRQPKQPDELGPGEQFKLEDHQTVADYGELTTASLLQRVLELPGGEALRDKRDREDMIDFIKKSKEVKRRANLEQKKGAKPIRPVEAEDDGEEIVIDGDE